MIPSGIASILMENTWHSSTLLVFLEWEEKDAGNGSDRKRRFSEVNDNNNKLSKDATDPCPLRVFSGIQSAL